MLPVLAHLGCGGERPPDDVSATAGVPGEEQTRLDSHEGASWGCEPLGGVAALHGSPAFLIARDPQGRPSGGCKPCVASARPAGSWSKRSLALPKEGREKQNMAHVVPKPRAQRCTLGPRSQPCRPPAGDARPGQGVAGQGSPGSVARGLGESPEGPCLQA